MSNRMKILIVTGIFPPDIGGPATYVPAVGNELVKRGHQVTVVTLSDALQNHESLYLFRVVRVGRRTFKPFRVLLAVTTILIEGRHANVLLVGLMGHETDVAVRHADPLEFDDSVLRVRKAIEETGDDLAHGISFAGRTGP